MGQAIEAVAEILRFNAGRNEDRLAIKYKRMKENVFAFFRGTDHLFATRWESFRPASLGPDILLCGDLHLENFGAFAIDDGDFRYDINDFDEALLGPVSVDVVRLTASILLAGEVWKVPTAHATGIALEFLASYQAAMAEAVKTGKPGEIALGQGAGPIWDLLGKTALGNQEQLLAQHTKLHDGRRHIDRSEEKHPDVSDKKEKLVREAVELYGSTTPAPDAFRVLDVAGRIMGIGSLGLRRYTVLVAGGGTLQTNRLLDVKEEQASSVLRVARSAQPRYANEAVRVVEAQRQLQCKPPAGLAAIEMDGRPYPLRSMIPDENRSKLDRLQGQPEKLRTAMKVVGQLTAWGQVRGCASGGADARRELVAWSDGALDSVLAAAVRCVDLTCQDFDSFCQARHEGVFDKPKHA